MVISSKSCQKFRFNCLTALQLLNGFMFLQSWQTVSNLQSSLSRAIIGKVIYNIMFQNETLKVKCFRFSHLVFSQKQEMFLSECQVHERALRKVFEIGIHAGFTLSGNSIGLLAFSGSTIQN